MNVSAKSDYACRAVLELALRFDQDCPLTTSQIAEVHEIPHQFLVQILLLLKAAGLVQSSRGAGGGYRLTRAPNEVSLGDVIQAVEGNGGETVGGNPSPLPSCRILRQKWDKVADAQQTILSGVNFADLAEEVRASREPMYYI